MVQTADHTVSRLQLTLSSTLLEAQDGFHRLQLAVLTVPDSTVINEHTVAVNEQRDSR